jgi:hypothetical protein
LLLHADSAMFQICHGKNKLSFNEMMMRSALSIKKKEHFDDLGFRELYASNSK